MSLSLGIAVAATGVLTGLLLMFLARFERRRQQRQMERLAFYDSVTGVANRLLFMDRAAVAVAQAKRSSTFLAVVFLDLDRFKLVNDSYGHTVGDLVLKGVASRLRESLREGDTVARFGGDEFTVLMPGIKQRDDVSQIASKLLDVFRLPLHLSGRDIMVTASIGIAMYPGDGTDAETLLKAADTAMYRAKETGGDTFQVYTRELDRHTREELDLESRLRLALARNEFVLYYQPRVDAASARVVAFEALLRWNDPDRGILVPRQFMHSTEISGLIIPIGQWVIQSACRQARQWHEEGCPGVVVSVNLSPRQFHRHDLTRTITDALRAAHLEPQYLELEVDESCVMKNADASMRILHSLKDIGVRVLISHFGAGYSSLRYLRSFPIDGLKLDRSFVAGTGIENRPLATAALGMAKALHLKVIGEGVETQEAADFLRSQACDDIQGFLVSEPVPPQDCVRFIRGLSGPQELSGPNKVRNRSLD